MENTVDITQSEYDELLRIKKQYLELINIKSRSSTIYKKYQNLVDFDKYFSTNQPELYKDIKKSFDKFKKLGII